MKATIRVEGKDGRVRCRAMLEDAQLEHLFEEFRNTVNDFRAANLDQSWQLRIDVEDDVQEVGTH